MSSCGIAAGAGPVYEKLESLVKGREDVELKKVGCIGLCFHEPLVEIERDGKSEIFGEVTAENVVSLLEGSPALSPILSQTVEEAPENPMMDKQVRIVLRNCGLIDPQKIEEYEERGGNSSLRKSVFDLTQTGDRRSPKSGSGAGEAPFFLRHEWRFAHEPKGFEVRGLQRGEGDPGAFMTVGP
jgi:NADH-quinone oxidoreductase subunit F